MIFEIGVMPKAIGATLNEIAVKPLAIGTAPSKIGATL
jgi:hypothetical protein